MSQIAWHEGIEKAEPLIFRIFTPGGSGTGFLVSKSDSTKIVAIATALHVVGHAHMWEEPIRVQHYTSGKIFLLKPQDRAILCEENQDTAAIIFEMKDFALENQVPELIDTKLSVKTGVEIGWLGFPAVSSGELCFFSGRISSSVRGSKTAYLVDGVAINGVSGGPAIWLGYDEIRYIGVVSAYIPNRSTGEPLPGLSVIQDVTQFHDVVSQIRSIEEAKEKESKIDPESTEIDSDHSESKDKS